MPFEYPKDYYKFNIIIFRLSGLWTPDYNTKLKNVLFSIYNTVCVLYCIVFFTFSEYYLIFKVFGNIDLVIKCLSWSALHTVSIAKVIIWQIHKKTVLKLMEELQNSEYTYESSENFQPNRIAKGFTKEINTFLGLYFWTAATTPIFACVMTTYNILFAPESVNAVDESGNTIFCANLPFTTWIPFEISTKLRCFFASTMQGLGVLYFGYMIIALDCVLASSLNFLTTHIIILQGAFRTFRQRTLDKFITNEKHNSSSEDIDVHMKREINKCTKHLQTIIRMTDTLERIYNIQTLLQVLITLFVFSTCLYLVSSTPVTSKLFLSEVTYMLAVQWQFCVYCWFGNELTLASEGIPQAIYESAWFDANESIKRTLLINMIRMKKPLLLTVGKYSPLTLTTLVTIYRSAYSLMTLIKNTNL